MSGVWGFVKQVLKFAPAGVAAIAVYNFAASSDFVKAKLAADSSDLVGRAAPYGAGALGGAAVGMILHGVLG